MFIILRALIVHMSVLLALMEAGRVILVSLIGGTFIAFLELFFLHFLDLMPKKDFSNPNVSEKGVSLRHYMGTQCDWNNCQCPCNTMPQRPWTSMDLNLSISIINNRCPHKFYF